MEILELIKGFVDYKTLAVVAGVSTGLLIISEALGLSKKFKDNAVYGFVARVVKSLAGMAKK